MPQVGEGWQVRFAVTCTATDDPSSSPETDYERTYKVAYAGSSRGYRLDPIRRFKSPHRDGPKTCTMVLTPIRPDGKELTSIQGHYTTPAEAPAE